ncbi:MAG: DNA translocase FtsK 4TM domain-containing protein, partial [Bdellovibrionaceae bacterium]|nr:DNA translocase FtsK 4TM domain-containing protein [Pseudobdellovibrionaceae bacterium]
FGSAINQGLFSTFGIGFFYLAVMALHMGYVTNMHVFSFKDFKKEYQVLGYSTLAHIIILTMFSTIFAVVQIYFEMPNGEVLNRGTGGFIGNAFGQLLYAGLGVYGSVLLLLIISFATSLVAGFYELNDVLSALKDGAVTGKVHTIKAARKINQSIIHAMEFILKDHEVATANISLSGSKNWMSQSLNKANNFFTDHFHINTDFLDRKSEVKETIKEKVKKTVKKASPVKSTKVNALKSLTARKPKKKAIVAKKTK